MFEATTHDFGTVARGAKAEFEFVLTNIYLEDVHISDVHSSCGCTSVSIERPLLKTYEKGAILAHINTDSFLGSKGATVTVTFDKPFYAQVQLHTRVYIRSDVVLEPGSVEVGTVDQGKAVDRTVAVSYAGRNDWKIIEVKSANPHITAKAVETHRGSGQVGYNVMVHIDENLPAGYLRDHLVLVTNDQNKTEVPVAVEGVVQSSIVVSPTSLFMGVVHPGQKVTKQLVVRAKQPFRILSVQCDGKGFEFDTSAEQSAKSLHLIPVTFVAGEEPGKILKTIRIETDLGDMKPELSAYAVVAK
jgi:hypothetical protein